ncbi:MAG: hypothetical protein ACHQRM_03035 [Bacteroidia bacterium]
MNPLFNQLFRLTIFSIAMGFLESAVVIYLRMLYYPAGFHFPLALIPPDIARVEIGREAATIIMLVGAGILAARDKSHRFALFIYAFAVWDLFYYVFLKLFIGWPDSLLTWDILFLLPVPWIGPVLAPCIVSITLILITILILYYANKGRNIRFKAIEWTLLGVGGFIIIWSFCEDYLHLVIFGNKPFWRLSGDKKLFSDLINYVPVRFNWSMFLTGEVILLLAIMLYLTRLGKPGKAGHDHSGWFSEIN